MSPRRCPPDPLQYELLQEKAASLGRAGRRLERSLEALRGSTGSVPGEDLLTTAARDLWYYVVQREACGLRDTETFLDRLGVTRELRLRMGCAPPPGPASTPRFRPR